jgi:hypothetical protein
VPVSDRDNGYKATLEAIEKSKRVGIAVGIHAEAGGEVLEKAEANEFGTETAPARPFVSGWADENREEAIAKMRAALEASIKARKDPHQRFEQLALLFAGQIQQRIAGGIEPPNAPATIARKGSSTPLIDTGQLRSSVTGKVTDGKGG